MGTTLYGASSGSPGITPGRIDGNWSRQSSGMRTMPAVTSDSSSGTIWNDSFVGSIHSACLGQWVYGPLAAQTISGSVHPTVYGIDATFNNIYTAKAAVWIAQPNGSLRGTLLSGFVDGTLWNTSLNAYDMGSTGLTSQVATAGDYLILEAGLDDSTFINSESGGVGAGNSRTQFTFSGTITTFIPKPASMPSTLWIGRPQPRRN